MRRVRRPGLVLVAIVGVSAVLHALAARRMPGLWIFPDEGIYAQRALAFWHHGTLPSIGYSALYPIVVGLPLSIGSVQTGLHLAKLLQSVVVSLAAVPVYLYGRTLMRRRYALVAAAFTVASPLLLYSGLLMTEVLFYPLAAWTTLAMARAVGTAARRDLVLALILIVACVLTRTQAVVFVPIFVAAVCVDAVFARSTARLRRFWPLAAILLLGAVVIAARPATLGSYAVTVRGSYPAGLAFRLFLEDLALIVLATAVLPAVAFCLLLVEGVRGRLAEPQLRALVAMTAATFVLLPAQVAVFAARFAPHLLERDLAALPPLLFTVFAAWYARGHARPFFVTAATLLGLGALVLLTPWSRIALPVGFPDSFSLMLFFRLRPTAPATYVAFIVPLLLVLFAFVPRRASVALLLAPFALLVASSAVASDTLAGVLRSAQVTEVGPVPNWIDRAATGNVAYLYDAEAYWNVVWQQRFWNQRITHVYATTARVVPGPMPQTPVAVPPSGLLPISEPYVVATNTHSFVGTPVARLPETAVSAQDLILWRLEQPARLSFEMFGFQPNGDIDDPVTIKVFDCGGGTLQLTLLTKDTSRLRIRRNGRPLVDQRVQPNSVWRGSLPGVPARAGPRVCIFRIIPSDLLGSTNIDFVRP